MSELEKYLAEVKNRCEAATEGPFVVEKHNCMFHITNGKYGKGRRLYAEDIWDESLANLLAASRTDVPRLLEIIGVYREAVGHMEGDRAKDVLNIRLSEIAKGEPGE